MYSVFFLVHVETHQSLQQKYKELFSPQVFFYFFFQKKHFFCKISIILYKTPCLDNKRKSITNYELRITNWLLSCGKLKIFLPYGMHPSCNLKVAYLTACDFLGPLLSTGR